MLSRIATRVVRAPIRSFHSSAIARDWGWSKLVNVWTPATQINEWKELDNKLGTMKTELSGTPQKVDTIDWSYWESEIEDKTLLRQIRTEYESIKYEQGTSDLSDINNKLDTLIANGKKNIAIHQEEIDRYQKFLTREQKYKVEQHTWTFEQILEEDKYPGLRQQLEDKYIADEWWPHINEEALLVDPNEIRKEVASGKIKQIDFEALGLANYSFGDFNYMEEKARQEALMDRLYGDLPEYQAEKRKAAEEKAKKDANKHEDHHHAEPDHEPYL